jgi:hypothetical protein
MKRNIYGMAAVGAIAVFVLTACMVPPTQGVDQGSAAPGLQDLGPGGIQGHAPYGADPELHHHRLAQNR